MIYDTGCGTNLSSRKEEHWHGDDGWGRMNNGGAGRESGEEMDRRQADLPLDPRRLRNDDLNHRRGGYGRDRRRPPRSRSRIYLISPRGTTVPRQRVRPTVAFPLFLLRCLLFSLARPFTHSYDPYDCKPPFFLFIRALKVAHPLHPALSLHGYSHAREYAKQRASVRYIPMLIKRNTDP